MLAHATRGAADGLTEPATAYTVLSELAALAYALPQVCGQLAAWMEAEHVAGRLACDTGQPAAAAADPALLELRHAARWASGLGMALSAAQSAAGHLQRPGRGERP